MFALTSVRPAGSDNLLLKIGWEPRPPACVIPGYIGHDHHCESGEGGKWKLFASIIYIGIKLCWLHAFWLSLSTVQITLSHDTGQLFPGEIGAVPPRIIARIRADDDGDFLGNGSAS